MTRASRVTRTTRPGRALWRVLVAPGFVLALWLVQLGVAKLLAGPTIAAAKISMRGHTWFDDGHRVRAVIELLTDSPAIVGAIEMSLMASAVFAAVFSIVAAPAILGRLAGERSLGWLGAAVGRELGPMLVQTGYGLIFRAACTGLGAAALAGMGVGALPLAVLLAAFPVLVLDRARAAVVLDDERPYHPLTFLRSIIHVARRPLWWFVGTLLEFAKLVVAIAALLIVIKAGPSATALWIARATSLLALLLGLWRVALAVEDRHTPQA